MQHGQKKIKKKQLKAGHAFLNVHLTGYVWLHDNMDSANDRNSQLLRNTCWEPVTKSFMRVSSFYELGSEMSLRKELRFRDAKITQPESGRVSIQAKVCLTPRSL